jgi:hypothetical protein
LCAPPNKSCSRLPVCQGGPVHFSFTFKKSLKGARNLDRQLCRDFVIAHLSAVKKKIYLKKKEDLFLKKFWKSGNKTLYLIESKSSFGVI